MRLGSAESCKWKIYSSGSRVLRRLLKRSIFNFPLINFYLSIIQNNFNLSRILRLQLIIKHFTLCLTHPTCPQFPHFQGGGEGVVHHQNETLLPLSEKPLAIPCFTQSRSFAKN